MTLDEPSRIILEKATVKPLIASPGSIGHLRWLVGHASPFVRQVLIGERGGAVTIWARMRWWCWLGLGALHLLAHRQIREALSREGVAGVRYDVHVF